MIGAYVATSLAERTYGHQNLTYFGTGETFIFRLFPMPICYIWDKGADIGGQHGQKNKYVFIDTVPVSFETSNRRFSRRRSSARKSIMRRLSRRMSGKQFSRSVSVPHPQDFSRREPLSAINAKAKNSPIIPPSNPLDSEHMKKYLLRHNSMPASKAALSFQMSIDESKFRSQDSDMNDQGLLEYSRSPWPNSSSFMSQDDEDTKTSHGKRVNFLPDDTEEEEDTKYLIRSDAVVEEDDDVVDPPASLFISCDNSTFIIGGG